MRLKLLAVVFVLWAAPAAAQITLTEAQAEADAWVIARIDAIKQRVRDCIQEPGGPEKCHTAWSGSTTPNTAPTDSALATVTYDDPGTFDTACGGCFTGEQTFALAGINIPVSGPVNATVNIARGPTGRGEQLVYEIQYDGTVWQKAIGDQILPGFDWQEAVPTP